MPKVKIEVFLSVPPCSGGIALSRLLEEIREEFADKVDVEVHRGPTPRIEELKISALPALVVGDLVRIMGLCPSKESLVGALRECGVT
ncbi:MAG: thioredoxin family protein [Bacillota bacterium]